MNDLCFAVVALNLNKFLTIDFNKQKQQVCSTIVVSRLFKSASKKKYK